ncbi:MAG: hypothetical protein Kow00121_57770 [Elainellaceae cyanobacterium]
MYNLTNFTQEDMFRCAIALRNMNDGAKSMEEVANRIIYHLYENLVDQAPDRRACALVRFFKTHSYGDLNEDLQKAASEILGAQAAKPSTKCLTLLATAGEAPEWNSRHTSIGHKAIPLIDQDFIERAPMISQLIQQFGLEAKAIIEPNPKLLLDLERKTFNVFYIDEALGSEYIPSQAHFVIPYKIKTILGFGGMLPSGDLFAVIMFTRLLIPYQTAELFKWIAAYVRIAAAAFDQGPIFKP